MTRRIPLQVLSLVLLQQTLCSSMEIHLSIQEEQNEGVRIGTIAREFPPPYRLLTAYRYVELDMMTGDLHTTTHTIDREALCPQQPLEPCLILLLAVVGPNNEVIKVRLEIEDINDNSPHFQDDEIHLIVPEDVTEGTSFLLDHQARDEDAGSNGELWYSLDGADRLFSVTEEGPSLVVVVRGRLDREAQDTHRMAVIATDHGVPSRTGTATLVVEVTDVNDNCPTFSSDSPYTAVIPGDSPRGTVVTHVKATDPDLGSNAVITYSFNPKISDRSKALFKMDSNTGLITLSTDIDSDSPSEHVLRILASDPSCPPTVAEVTVSVQPAASQGLEIKIRYIVEHQEQAILLQENKPPTVLALLELDHTSTVKGTLSIAGEVPFLLKPQNGNYLLLSSRPLDFEQEQEYHITILVNGAQPSSGCNEKVITVLVEDVNDNAPQFQQTHYYLDLEENNEPGASLLQVRATDADSQQNGEVAYSLSPNVAAMFSIDAVTGQLFVLFTLDREKQEFHNFTILARDNGSPTLQSSIGVSIHVLDQNDNNPIFTTTDFIFFIPENFPRLGQVGAVGVTDVDAGSNGRVEVQVLNSSGPFLMDNARGTLRCIAEVDREMQDHYELWLIAQDHGRPPLSSTAKVTIFVEDVNDNQPRVILPASNLSCLIVSPSTVTGTTVTKIYAIDEDSGKNSDISYRIAASEPQDHSPFLIDTHSGNVTLGQRLLLRDHGLHHLFIVVSDGGEPTPLESAVWVNLLVNDTHEPCRLSREPVSYSVIQKSTQKPSPCERNESSVSNAQMMLFIGFSMMVCSVSLFLGTVILFIKQRTKRHQKRPASKDHEIPLKLKESYNTTDWTDIQ
ncbi:protocadherin-20 [Megalops cyprinoides]|uniref:protocadherin-20 n=1 Tax=Megalops cyprinoides TaxID=118141 RepID=UPI0018641737|nr:protocadherin-20 [Megalops cyprinoides]